MGVTELTREREPQGAVTRTEDAGDGRGLYLLAIALEDTNYLQNDDKRRIDRFVKSATRRIQLSRLPVCRWWQVRCKRDRAELQRLIDQVPPEP